MSVKVEKMEKSKVKLEFTVKAEEFEKALDQAFTKNAKHFKAPGFRAGKVPRNIVEKMYGESVLYEEAFDIIAEKEYVKAVEENNLEVVARPSIDVKEIGKGKDLLFVAEVCVKPEAKIKEYKGLKVEEEEVSVTNSDVTEEIEKVRERNARTVTVEDREVKNGDITNIDFEGFSEGVAFEGGKAEKFDLTIGSGQFIPGFEEQIIGMKIGDEKDINVTFPEEYHSESLAGKPVVFKIKLNEIKEKQLPNLDDEFAKDVSEFDTLDEYKKSVEEKLLDTKSKLAVREKESKVMGALVENVEVEIPEEMIEAEVDKMVEEFKSNIMYQGIDLDKYLELTNSTMEAFRAQFKDNAIRDIKLNLAIDYVIENEKITVEQKDIEEKIDELTKTYGKDGESFKNNENVKNYLEKQLKREKAMKFVVENSVASKKKAEKKSTKKED